MPRPAAAPAPSEAAALTPAQEAHSTVEGKADAISAEAPAAERQTPAEERPFAEERHAPEVKRSAEARGAGEERHADREQNAVAPMPEAAQSMAAAQPSQALEDAATSVQAPLDALRMQSANAAHMQVASQPALSKSVLQWG